MTPIAAVCMLSGLPIMAGEPVLVVPVSRRLREADWRIHSLPFRALYDGRHSYEKILKGDRPVEDLFLRQLRKDLVEAPPGLPPALLRTSPVSVLREAVSDTGRVRVRERGGPRGRKVPKGIPTWKRVMRLLRFARVSVNSVEIRRIRYGIVAVYPRTGDEGELARMEKALEGVYGIKRYRYPFHAAGRLASREYLAVGPKAPHPWPPPHPRERWDYLTGKLLCMLEGRPLEPPPQPLSTVALAFARLDIWDHLVAGRSGQLTIRNTAECFMALARGSVGKETAEDLKLLAENAPSVLSVLYGPGKMLEGAISDPSNIDNIERALSHTVSAPHFAGGSAELALHILDVRAAPIPEARSQAVGSASGRALFLLKFSREAGIPIGPRPFVSANDYYEARRILRRAVEACWDAD